MAEPRRLGKYEIIDEIGRGRYGVVYRGRDTILDREVALKVLHPQLLIDPTFSERFRREARTLARLRHANIVTVYEAGENAGQLYIAMELACGSSLHTAIAERGHIPWQETLELLEPICKALDYAHRQGVVHRDLKPSNILLDAECGPLLADFGIARLVGTSSMSLTVTGGIMGTPAYIAPEVWEEGEAKAPADIYALGCIVYEMLTGNVLFVGTTPMQTMRAHDRGPQFPAQWQKGIPGGLERVLGKALAHDPESRFASAGQMAEALKQVVDKSSVKKVEVAGQVSLVEDRRSRTSRQRGGSAKGRDKPVPTVLSPTQPFEPEMVLIPAGKFLMGSDPSKDPDAVDDEQPQRRLYLPDYYIARAPVTNAQYLVFVQRAGHEPPDRWRQGKPLKGSENYPVTNISWRDAVAYCEWLAKVTGEHYHLPSEAEWEKAARGLDGQIYPWGDGWDAGRCNGFEAGVHTKTPVGAYSPEGDSPYDCVDMAGNVWEWTSSLHRDYPYDPTDGREDLDADGIRVSRGGAYDSEWRFVRCAFRNGYSPLGGFDRCGFRCALSP
jgi:serine/threonine-protein kinase